MGFDVVRKANRNTDNGDFEVMRSKNSGGRRGQRTTASLTFSHYIDDKKKTRNNRLVVSRALMEQMGWGIGDKIDLLTNKKRNLIMIRPNVDGTRTLSGLKVARGRPGRASIKWLETPGVIKMTTEHAAVEEYTVSGPAIVFNAPEGVIL